MLDPSQINYPHKVPDVRSIDRSGPNKVLFNLNPTSVAEFNDVFRDIKDMTFIRKIKRPLISLHTVKIETYDGKIETAILIKGSGDGYRQHKQQRLGSGNFKYVQAAILIRNNQNPLKFALPTQEYFGNENDVPEDIKDELEISKSLKGKPPLHESVVIPQYFSPKIGKAHFKRERKYCLDSNGVKDSINCPAWAFATLNCRLPEALIVELQAPNAGYRK